MMCNPKTGKTRRMRALAVVPAIAAALVLTNIPSVASTITDVAEMADEVLVVGYGKGTEKSVAKQDSVPTPDVLPQYPGGENALYSYLAMNIIYPTDAAEKGEQGRTVVKFIVEPNGAITNCQVLKGNTPLLDAEAIRVVSNMPKWEPGKKDGKPIRCSYSLPVVFKLQ